MIKVYLDQVLTYCHVNFVDFGCALSYIAGKCPFFNTASVASCCRHTLIVPFYPEWQALGDEGRPLCVFCGKLTSSTAVEKHQGAAWVVRYCSERCKHENSVSTWSNLKGFQREQIVMWFEALNGVGFIFGCHSTRKHVRVWWTCYLVHWKQV